MAVGTLMASPVADKKNNDKNNNAPKAVDLGLPSGTKWASCNVGATAPEELGDYFAWGETAKKDEYTWKAYTLCEGKYTSIVEYCTSERYGKVDDKKVLDLEDDAANVQWGGKWRIPTIEEQKELIENCTWSWETLNGVTGYKVTSKKNPKNFIFLPAGGYVEGTEVVGVENDAEKADANYGYYMSSSLGNTLSLYNYCMYFNSSASYWLNYSYRSRGCLVRPVCE